MTSPKELEKKSNNSYITEYKFSRYIDLNNASHFDLFWERFKIKSQLSVAENDPRYSTVKLKAYLHELCEFLNLCEKKDLEKNIEKVKKIKWTEPLKDEEAEKVSKVLMIISGFMLVFFTFSSVYTRNFQLGLIAFVDLLVFSIASINYYNSKDLKNK